MKKSFVSLLASIVTLSAAFVGSDLQATSAPTGQAGASGFDLAAMKMVIEANNRRFTAAHVKGDQATIDDMFTLDAKCLPPGSDPVVGRAAIAKLTAEYIAGGVAEFREETTDFYGNEELLIDQGKYVMVYGKEHTRETGKYVNIWRKEEGVWKIYSNIWNTNAPELAAK